MQRRYLEPAGIFKSSRLITVMFMWKRPLIFKGVLGTIIAQSSKYVIVHNTLYWSHDSQI
jgi:hypothetical protein